MLSEIPVPASHRVFLTSCLSPFFTSKPAGEGTGLGLSISYGIIKNHGGTLSVDSILNKYTEMIITIPGA